MEQKFYTDNFEQLLRETTDDFRMYPSRRVWHSLYNDLHPSRKWPSFTVLLLLITSILYIGVSNQPELRNINTQITEVPAFVPGKALASTLSIESASSGGTNINNLNPDFSYQDGNNSSNVSIIPSNRFEENTDRLVNVNIHSPGFHFLNEQKEDAAEKEYAFIDNISFTGYIQDANTTELNQELIPGKNKITETSLSGIETDDSKKWMQEDVFYNKKSLRSRLRNLSYQVYGTPSFGYRVLSRNSDYNTAPPSLVAPSNEGGYESNLSHDMAMNFEVGANALYRYSKRFRFKAGLQLNFTNYRIHAYELNHPTVSTLMLHDIATEQPELEPRSTNLANTPGLYSTSLDNYTLQLAVPVGADFMIAGSGAIKWYAGANLQPTYVANGDAYLISSDMKNYIKDNDLLRKFNLNGAIESFISYKTKSGVTLNAGPQLRYQFLSTYSNRYNYEERLYNIGLKLGVTTTF